MEIENRKNINRGFRKLLVWQESIQIYVFVSKVLSDLPFELKKSVANALDSSLSIQRNITEGYCRKSIKSDLDKGSEVQKLRGIDIWELSMN